MDAKLGDSGPLARFIALRREPGDGWLSFGQIADELTAATGIPLTGPGVKKWADALGIPMTNKVAQKPSRDAYAEAVAKYLRAPRGERTA